MMKIPSDVVVVSITVNRVVSIMVRHMEIEMMRMELRVAHMVQVV